MAGAEAVREQAEEISRDFSRWAKQAGDRLQRAASPTSASDVVRWAVVASVSFGLGLLAGVLLAPRSGEETRNIVKDKAVEYSKDISDRVVSRIPSMRG